MPRELFRRIFVFPRFVPQAVDDVPARTRGLEVSWIERPSARIETWFLPGDEVSAERPGPLVVFAHGNGEFIDFWPDMLAPFRRLGLSVLLPEFRGYGRSTGRPSEHRIVEDFDRAIEAALTRPDVNPKRLVFCGRSIGGGVVCALARIRAPVAMILMSTFTSLDAVAKRWFVPRAMVLDHFESLDVIRSLDIPILIVHGTRDRIIPVSHGRKLAAAGRHARLVEYDADHNDCPPDWGHFTGEVAKFLAATGVLPAQRTR